MTERKKPARWRKCGGRWGEPLHYALYRGGQLLACVRSKTVLLGHTSKTRWFWHLPGQMREAALASATYAHADEARRAALVAVRALGFEASKRGDA